MIESLDGATTALHRRIEELTAELDSLRDSEQAWKARAESGDAELAATLEGHSECLSQLQEVIDTERAAREQAEKERDYWRNGCESEQEGKAALVDDLEQAERERDTALARVKELTVKHDLLAERSIHTESALASALSLLGRAHQFGISHPAIRRDVGAFLSSAPSPAPVAARFVSGPCSGCAAARELLNESGTVRRDTPEHINAVFAWLKEHGE